MNKFLTMLALLCGTVVFGQTSISGSVSDSNTGDPLPGVNVRVVGKAIGNSSDFDGNFTLTTNEELPFSIEFTFVGYQTQTIEISGDTEDLQIALVENATSLDEVVVSASRTPESVRESPVTIERIGIRDLKSASSPSFYEGLENLKGVDMNRGSLTFNSINTRGFATFSNERFVQLVDGMDSSSPALNFPLGNLVGVNELDLQSVEIIPGAASALYGANAFNGILFMNTRNPFENTGVSTYAKTGLTVQKAAGDNVFYDLGVRYAHAFNEKFALKASISYIRGTDWYANDDNMYSNANTNVGEPDEILAYRSGPAHDGLNIYGDEVSLEANGLNFREFAQLAEASGQLPAGLSGLIPEVNVARTGYYEEAFTDYKAESFKYDAAFHYRPNGDDLEIIFNTRGGYGSTFYQGTNRYALKNFLLQQHKLEIRNNDFFVRGYMVTEDAGDSYDMRFTGINIAKYKATEWFGAYLGGYLEAVLGGATEDQAHNLARVVADSDETTTPKPGSELFNQLFDEITSDGDLETGSKFIDQTKMYIGEGNYNFARLLDDKWDLQVGGSYRQYSLNSEGTIFTDYDGPINYGEYGMYVQGIKKLMDDRLKLQASIRYDKNEFFDGNFSPRASITYAAGEARDHNIRASFQTGFRNPTTQDLFIGLDAGRAILVGSSPDNLDRDLPNTPLTGRKVYSDSYTASSVSAFAATGDPTVLNPVVTGLVKPEKIQSFDVGYRGIFGKIYVDVSGYYSNYKDFISNTNVVTPISGTTGDLSGVADIVNGNFDVFQTYTNSKADISSYGGTIGLNAKVLKKLDVGVNYTLAKFDFDQSSDPDFSAGFNTPEHKWKFSVGSPKIVGNLGFNFNLRWSDEYLWQATIANAVIPERTVVDAQINYYVPKINSMFKMGGANLGGTEYQSAVGAPFIGTQFFVSWVFNQ
ncbi:TonB-dependent receptor [Lutimonas zeaxanthinifaciens]|uniref:TonB-dependent receptor n=1 Tax=Lutimonas zeaxanthinifaciens TaxID=3060215 RepID=UPI00265D255A|nr:TonB-dependent receptor [Lutimonas sp. YSD2104]WKK65494.1 TonB-dependent receptor [Lutimonas sp. YSD2104]